jgi:hypothetical protein
VAIAIGGYSLCSSTLLLANKFAIEYLPKSSVVSFIQIISTSIAVVAMKLFGVEIDALEWSKVKPYSIYIFCFVASIYSNMQALAHLNVETVIVFRACSPISVCLIEYFFMDRNLPNARSSASLGLVAFGALLYCMSDSEFVLNGLGAYTWAIIYFFFISVEMTYGKKLISSVRLNSVWAPVLYCNVLAAFPMFMLGFVNGDYEGVGDRLSSIPTEGIFVLLFSCVVGTLIGYTNWLCRGMVSATTFTLVGVVCKFITVLLNVCLWGKHSSPMGLFAVCICLLSGTFYQQAPRRDEVHKDVEESIGEGVEIVEMKGNSSSDFLLPKDGEKALGLQ